MPSSSTNVVFVGLRGILSLSHLQLFANGPMGRLSRIAKDSSIERVPLDWFAPRFKDQTLDLLAGQQLGRRGPGIVIDQFMPDGAIDVVRAVGQSRLSRTD